jgi:hypothetical protein
MFHPLSDEDRQKLDLLSSRSEAQNNPEISDILLEVRMLGKAILQNTLPGETQDHAIQKLHEIIQVLGSAIIHGVQ